MKKILITGANSYIGTSFETYIQQYAENYQLDTVDMIDGSWRDKDFSEYDVVYHVAGIAHQKECKENVDLYYKVNRDLAVDVAKKAQEEGVKQFIFLSSMSVYGKEEGVITKETLPVPKSHYGISKLQAEQGILVHQSENFRIAVLRPPMVYGEGCKGNYQTLVKIAEKLPIFADYKNVRSMVEIGVLCSFVKNLIDEESAGLFFPQNKEYVCTCKMIQSIAQKSGKNFKLTKLFNPAIWILKTFTRKGKKAFGNLVYADDLR